MKLFLAKYEIVVILAMQEPCGIMSTTSYSGEIPVQAVNEVAAETKAVEIIESNFTYDYISSIAISEVSTPPENFPTKDCKECEFNSNGTCVLII